MNADASHKNAERTANLDDALAILDGLEGHRNLNTATSILLFFSSSGFAVLSFFFISDLVLWEGVKETVAQLLIALSWILIFPIWILAFLFAMSLLDTMGIKDVRAVANHRLSALMLSPRELHELRDLLAHRERKHGHIFESVVTDLANANRK